MLQQELPAQIADTFESAEKGTVVLFSVRTDLELGGAPCEQWLVATPRTVMVARTPEAGGVIQSWSLNEFDAFRASCAVGSGFLQGRAEGAWVDLVRYSNHHAAAFTEVARSLERLIHYSDFEVAEVDAADDRQCPKCGARLPASDAACARCLPPQRILRRVWALLAPYRGAALLMFGLALVAVGIELLPPILQKILVDRVLKSEENSVEMDQLLLLLLSLVAGLAVIRLVAAGIAIWKGALSSRIGTSLTADLRSQMVQKLHQLSVAYYDHNQVGMLMSRVSYDTEAMHTLMHQVTGGFILQLLQLIGIGVMLFWLNAKLAFFTLLPMPLVLAGSWYFTRFLYPRHHSYWESVGRQASALTGMLSGIRVVKAFAQEDREYSRFERSSHRLRDARQQVDTSTATFSSLIGFTFGLGALIVCYVGGSDVLKNEMTLGSLMAFIMYLSMFYTPLTSLTESTTWISNFLAASQRIFELLDTPSQVAEPRKPAPLKELKGSIRFQNVSFSYDDQRRILDNVSFEVQPGELIGIVGRSGSGKSTVVNLVSRMYDATKGRVTIDGTNVKDCTSRDLRQRIGVVLQEPFLFEGTIEENIAYGKPGADQEQVLVAAKASSAHDFILRTPFAYETVIGERGSGLSGGERQRLSIARALLYDPQILILDEATSSVDTESERVIQEAIRHFSKGRTTLAIAHRLSTLQHADRLLVFNQGRLIEQGSPRELLKKNGVYASLVRIQSGISHGVPATAEAMPDGEAEAQDDLTDGAAEGPLVEASESSSEPTDRSRHDYELRWLVPASSRIYSGDRNVLCVEEAGKHSRGVIAVRAFPSRFEEEFISLQIQDDQNGLTEVGMIRRLSDWPEPSQEAVRTALRKRYLLRVLHSVHSLATERGHFRCQGVSDSGPVDFLFPSNGNSMRSFGWKGCLLVDVNDNYYVIPDLELVPPAERSVLALYVNR